MSGLFFRKKLNFWTRLTGVHLSSLAFLGTFFGASCFTSQAGLLANDVFRRPKESAYIVCCFCVGSCSDEKMLVWIGLGYLNLELINIQSQGMLTLESFSWQHSCLLLEHVECVCARISHCKQQHENMHLQNTTPTTTCDMYIKIHILCRICPQRYSKVGTCL